MSEEQQYLDDLRTVRRLIAQALEHGELPDEFRIESHCPDETQLARLRSLAQLVGRGDRKALLEAVEEGALAAGLDRKGEPGTASEQPQELDEARRKAQDLLKGRHDEDKANEKRDSEDRQQHPPGQG